MFIDYYRRVRVSLQHTIYLYSPSPLRNDDDTVTPSSRPTESSTATCKGYLIVERTNRMEIATQKI